MVVERVGSRSCPRVPSRPTAHRRDRQPRHPVGHAEAGRRRPDEYRLWVLNGQRGLPDREGETSFVVGGQRRSPRLSYVPSRAVDGADPCSTASSRPTRCSCTPRARATARSAGVEVNVNPPAAIEAPSAVARDRPGQRRDAVDHRRRPGRRRLIDVSGSDRCRPPRSARSTRTRRGSVRWSPSTWSTVDPAGRHRRRTGRDAARAGRPGGLRIWTEMFSDSVLALERVGALDRQHPHLGVVPLRLRELLDWVG